MSQKQTVTINGREYDARTGLPVTQQQARTSRSSLRSQAPAPHAPAPQKSTKAPASAHAIHKKTQRSTTLNRQFTKKPAHHIASNDITVTKRTPLVDGMRPVRQKRQPAATQLAPQKNQPTLQSIAQPAPRASASPTPAITQHPAVAKAHKIQSANKQPVQTAVPSASVLKQAAINEALENAPKQNAKQHRNHRPLYSRLVGAVFGCMALVLFGGYFTYLNVPNLSVRVAAAQAGIDASYPGYRPDGYRLNGPVAYSDGQVRMKFAANTGETNFTLNQSKSSWDSSALLENYVKEQSSDEYSTSQEKGITIYNYGSNAAWVSGGILYTLEGTAPLSPDQIRKIATSV